MLSIRDILLGAFYVILVSEIEPERCVRSEISQGGKLHFALQNPVKCLIEDFRELRLSLKDDCDFGRQIVGANACRSQQGGGIHPKIGSDFVDSLKISAFSFL